MEVAMLVRLWMSARVAVLLSDVRVSDALRHLRRTGVGHAAVTCRGKVLGVVSEADLRAPGAGR
jgi:CBS domain-containing protein